MSHRDRSTVRALVALGTRAEAIKLLPVIRALRAHPRFEVRTVSTGQHRDLVDQVLAPFGLSPDDDLGVMVSGQSLEALEALAVPRLDAVMARWAPDVVIVQGDTTSALCAALAAHGRRVPVAHVEAGLRSHDLADPYPEELNRRRIASVATLHLAPTRAAEENLLREGVSPRDVVVTGNTAVDALLLTLASSSSLAPPPLASWPGGLVLVTIHRRETWAPREGTAPEERHAGPLTEVLLGVRHAALANPSAGFLFPVHPNPRVREAARELLGGVPNVTLTAPLSHAHLVQAMRRATVILTDSGGIQEEAPSLGVPCLVARRTTERPEGLGSGSLRLVGRDALAIALELQRVLDAPSPRPEVLPCPNPYGDGRASERITRAILHRLQGTAAPEAFPPGPFG